VISAFCFPDFNFECQLSLAREVAAYFAGQHFSFLMDDSSFLLSAFE
jgi:hypothetical protein